MLIDPRHLQILAAIVDTGSLSDGAIQLGKSQPSLSRTLASLEARLGAPLFEKGKRPLQPTELGRALAVEGRIIAKAAQTARQIAQNHASGSAGTLRLAGSPVFMDGVISQMIASFQATNPGVRIDQSYGYLDDIISLLEHDQIDIGFCPVPLGKLNEGFAFTPLLDGRNVIACRATHPLARKASLSRDDLEQFSWIAPPADSPLYADLRNVIDEIQLKNIQISFSGGSLSALLNILTGSDSLTILPQSVVFLQRPPHALAALPIRITHPKRQLGMLRLQNRPRRPAETNLERSVVDAFTDLKNRFDMQQRRAVWHA